MGGKVAVRVGERVVVALSQGHPLTGTELVRWNDLVHETMLGPTRGPGPEFINLFASRIGVEGACRVIRHDVSLDRLLTLVGAGWGLVLALEGATGASYPGVVFREVHGADGPERLNFRAYWCQVNSNP